MRVKDKAPVPLRIAIDGIALGDHIFSLLPEKDRHGIYAGSCQVVCYAGGVIAMVPLDTFAAGGGIDVKPGKAEYTASEIVRRAKGMTAAEADFEFASGEHFCKWCRRGPLPVDEKFFV